MSPEERDAAYLWDMLAAARKIVDFTCGATYDQYSANDMMKDAVERNLSVTGEAARHVSPSFQAAHPEVPFGKIIGLRNIVVHEYRKVDHEEVWGIVTEHIPALIEQLAPLIPPPPPEEPE